MEEDEVERFGALFERFLEQVVHVERPEPGRVPLAERLEQHLGAPPEDMPVVREVFAPFEHATLQVALDALTRRGEPGGAELIGISGHEAEHSTFAQMVQMSRWHGSSSVGPVQWMSVAVAADAELTCVRVGVYLVTDGPARLAVLLRAAEPEYGRAAAIEVLAADTAAARSWMERLRAERAARNLLRGQVLSFEANPFEPGTGPMRFHRRPDVARSDVVLPADVLDRVERQVAGIARHRDRLVADGRHLKRGVLLYGPPGTGKTHTVRWLTGLLRDFTVVLLAGQGIAAVGTACALARTLQPALIVLEDVDLVAHDRGFSPQGANPLLFTVLDQMDGLAADADVAFLLTTNRVDLLEPALAQRPGRVDLAVEVPLPDPGLAGRCSRSTAAASRRRRSRWRPSSTAAPGRRRRSSRRRRGGRPCSPPRPVPTRRRAITCSPPSASSSRPSRPSPGAASAGPATGTSPGSRTAPNPPPHPQPGGRCFPVRSRAGT